MDRKPFAGRRVATVVFLLMVGLLYLNSLNSEAHERPGTTAYALVALFGLGVLFSGR